MKQILILFICLVANFLKAQDAQSDFAAMNKAMQADNYSSIIEYKTFLDNVLTETAKSTIYVKDDKYRLEAGNVIKINNNKINLLVDNNNKKLIVSEADNVLELSKSNYQIDSFLAKASTINFNKKENQIGQYIITLNNSVEKKIEIDFDLTTFIVKRIFIVYSEKEINEENKEQERSIEINYVSFNKTENINDVFFDVSSFVNKKGKKYTPTLKYIKYEFLNLYKN